MKKNFNRKDMFKELTLEISCTDFTKSQELVWMTYFWESTEYNAYAFVNWRHLGYTYGDYHKWKFP